MTDLLPTADGGRAVIVSVVGEGGGIGKSRLARALVEVGRDADSLSRRGGALTRTVRRRCGRGRHCSAMLVHRFPWLSQVWTWPDQAEWLRMCHCPSCRRPIRRPRSFRRGEAMVRELRALITRRPLLAVGGPALGRHLVCSAPAASMRHSGQCPTPAGRDSTPRTRGGCGTNGRGRGSGPSVFGPDRPPRGLDVDAAAALLRAATGQVPDPDEVALMRGRTRGNPFFLFGSASLQSTGDVPAAVGDIVARRLDVLPVRNPDPGPPPRWPP